jgi:hypothetical protein
MGTDDAQPVATQLRGAGGPDQERDIATGLSQAASDISAGRTGSDDE